MLGTQRCALRFERVGPECVAVHTIEHGDELTCREQGTKLVWGDAEPRERARGDDAVVSTQKRDENRVEAGHDDLRLADDIGGSQHGTVSARPSDPNIGTSAGLDPGEVPKFEGVS